MKKASRTLCLLAAATATLTLASCSGGQGGESFNKGFYNPVRVEYEMGDPYVFQHDGRYYYTHSDGNTLTITASDTLSGILFQAPQAKQVFAGSEQGLTDIWAPEIFFYDGHWYCYFAADINNRNELHRMYALKSATDDALGEWDYVGKIDLPDDQWSIDGTFLEHEDKLYMIWSGWADASVGVKQSWKQDLYIARLQDGDPTKVLSDSRVKISEATYLWENGDLPQNEGPCILKAPGGTVYCLYSANFSGKDNYALGQLKLTGDPLDAGSWEKAPSPFMATDPDADVYSPGHCSVTKSADGKEDWLLYHGCKYAGSGWDRSARLQKIEWEGETPVAAAPASLNTLISLPSGEKVDRRLYEMEGGALTGAQVADWEGASGGKAVSCPDSAASVKVTVKVKKAGTYGVELRYGNFTQTADKVEVVINGSDAGSSYAPPTGMDGIFGMTSFVAPLQAGENTLEFTTTSPDLSLDMILLEASPLYTVDGQ